MEDNVERAIALFQELCSQKELSIPYAGIQSIAECIRGCEQETTAGLLKELDEMKKKMIAVGSETLLRKTKLPLMAAVNICEHILFKYLSGRHEESVPMFKKLLVDHVEKLAQFSLTSRERASRFAKEFISDGQTILTHGYSKVVEQILLSAAEDRRFKVVVTESRPKNLCENWKKSLETKNIPYKVILDSAIGLYVPKVDYVLVGAEAVVQNGGIVNYIGTLSLAICAKSFTKPFYVAAESMKFLNIYPLSMKDFEFAIPSKIGEIDNPISDFTPPEYITLLFTDMGTFTASAVSDNLIQFYHT